MTDLVKNDRIENQEDSHNEHVEGSDRVPNQLVTTEMVINTYNTIPSPGVNTFTSYTKAAAVMFASGGVLPASDYLVQLCAMNVPN